MHLRLAIAALTWCIPTALVPAADLVLRGGKIVTVDPQFRIVQAMAVHDGRIVALGTDEQIAPQIDQQTQIVDLDGRMVLPGLIDSHVHPTGASQYEADHEIPPMETIDDVLSYVRARAAVVPKGEWIVLQQVFITRLREQRFPTRAELDSVAPEHPVWFRTGPDGSANSLALAENGIDRAFAAKHPDQVAVDPASGEPSGVIRRSSSIFKTRSDKSRKSLSQDERDDRLVELLEDYNRWGITGIIDRNCSDSARAQYARLLEANRLTTRVRLSRSLSPGDDLTQIDQRLDEITADPLFKQPDPRLGVIGVKVFEDGGMLTGSAYFTRPWGTSTIYGIVDSRYRGMQFIDDDRLEQLVRRCASRGLAFTAHCQGDAAVEALVDAYARVDQEIPIGPTRSSITHSSFMSPKAIAGAAKLGVGVDLQPAWLYLDARTLVAQFGSERLTHFIPLRSLFAAGVVAGGGSDHMQKIGSLRSVNPYNPFLGMWVAVTRTARWHDEPIHREQALTREQMIRFYTINNAWLMRAEDEIGSLEVGKRADFVVVDRDLLRCSDDEIRDALVESTWLDGRPVYQSQP
ncbi:N-substituted formamide deformylase precursor [Stieleria maiorica]|uniref:N-substituted formamide deformylase n=1 Tax=Stieleria maiorica TaxID=2795974 RepID=A0A5B9MNG2_9BACT|nr:amidohydrolase [Stieleria maiorica]QEG00408.1 N-substituted formamide deformylase precursor [Stieleria maiorica]